METLELPHVLPVLPIINQVRGGESRARRASRSRPSHHRAPFAPPLFPTTRPHLRTNRCCCRRPSSASRSRPSRRAGVFAFGALSLRRGRRRRGL